MKFFSLLYFSLLFLAPTLFAQPKLGIAASPMKLFFNQRQGSSQTLSATIHNPSSHALELAVSMNDWQRDSMGSIVFSPAGTLPSSCSRWVRVYPGTTLTLQPGEKKEVAISIDVPESPAAVLHNSMIFFTQLNPLKPEKESKGVSVNLAVRVGIQLYYTPPSLHKKDIEIIDFTDILPPANDTLHKRILRLTIRNAGEINTDGKVDLELLQLETGKKTVLPQVAFYTLPGAARIIQVPLSAGIPPGRYSATAMIDYGREEELKIAELEFRL